MPPALPGDSLLDIVADVYLTDRYRVGLAITFGTAVIAIVPNTLLGAAFVATAYFLGRP